MMKMSTMTDVVLTIDEDWKSKFAEKIAELWQADKNSVEYFRASANFIFLFRKNEEVYFLRFNRDDERNLEEIKNEIEIIIQLRNKMDNIVEPIKSKNGEYVESIETNLGNFYAVTFKALEGKQYEIEELEIDDFYDWGKSLGKLHKNLSKLPVDLYNNKKSYKNHLDFIKNNISANSKIEKEFNLVKKWIDKSFNDNIGLIHFDFELDNLRWKDKKISILDFDDMAIYPYEADIAFALRDLFEEKVDLDDEKFIKFIDGYKTEFKTDDQMIKNIEWFLRYHNLLTYIKLKRSTDIHKRKNAPESLIKLNNYLLEKNKNYENSIK